MSRYKLKGKHQWVLNLSNGWIKIHSIMIRWNTTWTEPFTYFSITNIKR